ncbi:MAG: phosphate-starvation-inducible PsiE family protein [Cyanobacteriota bacterium]|nr:phosphate-starvation-inducible PsiE family protein [Cyanobacteriota bacterium]
MVRLWLSRGLSDAVVLRRFDRVERQITKLLAVLLLVVVIVGSVQLAWSVLLSLTVPEDNWLAGPLTRLLGDLLNLLIALEVLQNLTAYLRRQVVQIELVLTTAMTAVARKVIVLPASAENKPMLLVGLGASVLALACAYWLVRRVSVRPVPARTGPATPCPDQDRLPADDAAGGLGSSADHRG